MNDYKFHKKHSALWNWLLRLSMRHPGFATQLRGSDASQCEIVPCTPQQLTPSTSVTGAGSDVTLTATDARHADGTHPSCPYRQAVGVTS
jgi:hypothetical protein